MAADKGFEQFRRPTKRDVFLNMRDKIMLWEKLCAVLQSHHPKGKGGRPVGQRMLHMLFVQHWFNLADEPCEEALCDSVSLRSFVGIDLGRGSVPDATTLLKSRRLLEKHHVGQALSPRWAKCCKAMG